MCTANFQFSTTCSCTAFGCGITTFVEWFLSHPVDSAQVAIKNFIFTT